MGSLSWLQSLVRFDRFDSAALEARYQREYYRSSVQACRTWATVEVAVMLTNISTAVAFSPSKPLMYWALYSIQIGGVLAMLFVVRSHSRPVRHLKDILCACYCLCLATFGAQTCVALQQQQLYNWGLSTALEGDVVHFLEAAMSFLYMCHYFVLYQPLTVPMLQLGFCPSSLAAILCGPPGGVGGHASYQNVNLANYSPTPCSSSCCGGQGLHHAPSRGLPSCSSTQDTLSPPRRYAPPHRCWYSMWLRCQTCKLVFQASVVTKAVSPPAPDRNAHPGTPMAAEGVVPPLPFGLRIAVMDDSASARTLLHHQLCQDVPGCVVDVFGASAADVEPFLRHTVAAADIAILDQHLDWPCGSVGLGTDLVRLLLQAGFRGLICIRSANMSEEDTHQYFAAGAHCVLDKLLSRSQTTATLATQYWRFFAAAQDRPTPSDEPAAASQCLLIPGMVSLM